jgi:hypothetical protein
MAIGRGYSKHGKIIYTVIIGDGFALREPVVLNPEWKHVCFTDQPFKSDVWEIRNVTVKQYSKEKTSRLYKIIPPIQCMLSLYLDSRFTIKTDLNQWAVDAVNNVGIDRSMVVMKHNKRDCAYAEARILQLSSSVQVGRYRREGFPEHFGLFAPGIMLRQHSHEQLVFNSAWAQEIIAGSHRDQISLAYTIWKQNRLHKVGTLPFRETYDAFMVRS